MEFGIFSPRMVQKLSVAKIHDPNTYDDDGYPIDGGLMDPRLGVIDPGIRCKTCGGRLGECYGHFGHIQLTRPVIHVGYAREIFNLIRGTCRACSRILLKPDDIEKYKKLERTEDVVELIWNRAIKVSNNNQKCPHCGEKQVKVKFVRPYSYYEGENNILVTDIKERFEKITDADLELLNFKIRPEWLILESIPVLPITTRPSITLESADRSEDDLTHKLVDILRINQRLEENINSGAPQLIIEDLWDLLQYHVATYFDNAITGVPPARHRSGRPLKTIAQRLKGKEGRFRNNLSGKRVNFSARTVVGPDPNISIDEVGIPVAVAVELTVPEEVNEDNIKTLRETILNGPHKHPGARNVISAGFRKRILDETKEEIAKSLVVGDVVERHLRDGDLVIFNRQPSLHRISMMCHAVRILPGNTFRINTAVCAPYNADFDGDEMNLHVPQSEEALAEAEILMKVRRNIISPRFGKPIVGGRHDHVTGTYYLTKDDTVLKRDEALKVVGGVVKLPKGEKFTGKEIFQLLLPKDLNLVYKAKLCRKCPECKKEKCQYDSYVVIKDGKLISGIIDSEGLSGTLLNEIFTRYGPDAARDFIDKSTILGIRTIMRYGFSVGIDEGDLSAKAEEEIKKLLKETESRINELIKMRASGDLKIIPGKSIDESLEDHVMAELGRSRTAAGRIAATDVGENSSVVMARTGARGSMLNLTQIAGTVGQQAVRGQRVQRGYQYRTLSCFKKHDVSAEANGFVKSSFKKGLKPSEYFFHSMGGRESLVDTAIRTGRSGYMQRRLINALQDLVVYNDCSVRGDGGLVIQFKYGEDGVDPMKKNYQTTDEEGALVDPGEAVGTVAAQSIGEPGTQMTLRTFHYAGVAELSVPMGLPRLIEIIDAKRSPKNSMMVVYLDENHRSTKEKATEVANQFNEVFLKDVSDIEVDMSNKEIIVKTENEEAIKILEKFKAEKRGQKFVIKKKSLLELKKVLSKLERKRVAGIKDVKRAFVRRQGEEYVIYTEGSNLKAVFGLKGVDKYRTTTNDISQIRETLGVEAARNAIIREAMNVLEDQHLEVDVRHIMLVADRMTVTGDLQAVGRQGISGSKGSVLARAAFEETEKHILNAALYGEQEKLASVAENIIVGQPVPVGTGTVKLAIRPGAIGKK